MMKAVGLVVEYNPFHNGHLFHLQQSKYVSGCDAVVAVMSGHFLQRGEPALIDKWTRAEMALAGGCDLVIELPVAYATSSAEWFAHGAVALLEATGVIDAICFGTESGQLAPLASAAKLAASNSTSLKQLLQEQLNLGASYPRAYSNALTQLLTQATDWQQNAIALDQPNHTLGLHYMVALERLNSSIKPYTIAREQAQYHDPMPNHHAIASATAIRKMLLEAQNQNLESISAYVPRTTLDLLERTLIKEARQPMHWERFTAQLFYQLSVMPPTALSAYREMEEGLEHRFTQYAKQVSCYSVEELLSAVKTKRYTRTKLQRALLAVLLQHHKQQFTREQLTQGIQYIRVLGFTEKGQQLLKDMKKKAKLPVIHSPAQLLGSSDYLQLDVAATSCYMQVFEAKNPKLQLADYHKPPIRL